MSYQGFILSNTQIRRDNGTQLIFQGRLSDGRRFHWTVTNPGIVFFINRNETRTTRSASRKELKLCSLRGEPVDALYFQNTSELSRARKAFESSNKPIYEADVNLVARFLMERFIKGGVSFQDEPAFEKNKMGMHFTQPTTRCRMWSWKSHGTPFRALIILELSRTLINGLAAKLLALNISGNFDGLMDLFAQVVGKSPTNRP